MLRWFQTSQINKSQSIIFFLLFVAPVVCVCASERLEKSAAIPKESEELQRQSPQQNSAAEQLHSTVNVDLAALQKQLTSDDIGAALAGAWSRVRLAAFNEAITQEAGVRRLRLPQRAVERFLGIVEGRLSVVLPNAWSKCVSQAVIWSPYETYSFPIMQYCAWYELAPVKDFAVHGGALDDPVVHVPKIAVQEADGKVTVSVRTGQIASLGEDENFELPEVVANAAREQRDVFGQEWTISSAIASNRRAFVVITDAWDPVATLYCIDIPTGKLEWSKTTINYGGKVYHGSSTWFTQMRIHEDRLFLFHCSERGIAIEGFDVQGISLFQFSSLSDHGEQ